MILITGGTGFIGREVVRQALDKELPLRVLVHNRLVAGIDSYKGDLLDESSLHDALQGVDTVIHLAAQVAADSPEKLIEINEKGTENLLNAAIAQGCKRFIFISSADAVHFYRTVYGQSKLAGEKRVTQSPLETLIIRPSVVLPDSNTSSVKGAMAKVALMAQRFKFVPLINSGNQSLRAIYCKELAEVIVAYAEGQFVNKTVIEVSSFTTTQKKLYQQILTTENIKAGLIPVPLLFYRLLLWPAGLVSSKYRVFLQKLVLASFDK